MHWQQNTETEKNRLLTHTLWEFNSELPKPENSLSNAMARQKGNLSLTWNKTNSEAPSGTGLLYDSSTFPAVRDLITNIGV